MRNGIIVSLNEKQTGMGAKSQALSLAVLL